MNRLDEPVIAGTLQALHQQAGANDDTVMERVAAAASERQVKTDIELADVLADAYMPIDATNGRLLHLFAAARPPGRIVEFGTSMGLSAIYLAAALSPDEAPMIATEMESAKVVAAKANLATAGLTDRVEIREGDAFETLADLEVSISLLFLDGWKGLYLPMLQLLEPHLVDGAFVIADDTTLLPKLCRPFLDYVRHPDSNYVAAELPLDDGLEICLYRAR
jgi:predicted O-methyltransferase YrrM